MGKHVPCLRTSAEAAEALRPIAGLLATLLFALGIVGTGLLAKIVQSITHHSLSEH